jgi:radical SAM-linked protein
VAVTDRQTNRMIEGIQRWRIAFRRGAPALEQGPPEIARAWEAALAQAGVPVVLSAAAKPRPRLTFAAGLPPGRAAEHDLLDVVLAERWSLPHLRSALSEALPAGLGIVDLYDVWLGAPSVSAALTATTHRVTVGGATSDELAAALSALLEPRTLERTRAKGAERQTTYDLRPLILALEVGPAAPIVRMLLRTGSDGPSGRPDEVIPALGEVIGRDLELVDLVRERLWTNDEAPTLEK